jgi:hypothetical protein
MRFVDSMVVFRNGDAWLTRDSDVEKAGFGLGDATPISITIQRRK